MSRQRLDADRESSVQLHCEPLPCSSAGRSEHVSDKARGRKGDAAASFHLHSSSLLSACCAGTRPRRGIGDFCTQLGLLGIPPSPAAGLVPCRFFVGNWQTMAVRSLVTSLAGARWAAGLVQNSSSSAVPPACLQQLHSHAGRLTNPWEEVSHVLASRNGDFAVLVPSRSTAAAVRCQGPHDPAHPCLPRFAAHRC